MQHALDAICCTLEIPTSADFFSLVVPFIQQTEYKLGALLTLSLNSNIRAGK